MPSVVFPSIIFPGILLDDYGTLVAIADPKIYGALTAVIVGFFSRNVILTIASGLTAVVGVEDYDYKIGTSSGTVADSGTVSRLTIKASF